MIVIVFCDGISREVEAHCDQLCVSLSVDTVEDLDEVVVAGTVDHCDQACHELAT